MNRNYLNFLTFNVRSLREVSRRLDLDYVLKDNNIDIAFIQETHLRQNHRVHLENYNFIKDNSSQGVGIAINKMFSYNYVEIPNVNFPNLFIQIKVMQNRIEKKILIGSIYFPCNSSEDYLFEGLSSIYHSSLDYNGVILGGDLNSKHTTWGDSTNNVNGCYLFRWLQQFSLEFVRISDHVPSFPNGNSFLDHFIVSSNLIDLNARNFQISSLQTFSDHFPLKLNIELPVFDIVINYPKCFISFRNTNWDNFKNDLVFSSLDKFPDANKNLSNNEIDNFIKELAEKVERIINLHTEKIQMFKKKS